MAYLLPFLFSFGLGLILVPIVIVLARKYGYVDDPRKKNPGAIHKKIMPRAGGLAIFLAFALGALFFLPINLKVLGILLGGLVLVIIGLVDDRRDLPKWFKLLVQLFAALIVVGSGIGIAFITNPLSPIGNVLGLDVVRLDTIKIVFHFFGAHSIILFADLFAVLWIVWVTNMVNFSSGVDGQMPGIVFVTLIVLFLASLKFAGVDNSQLLVSKLALLGAGSTLAFLAFNISPAKIFPGDSGSYFLGYLVAVISILSGAKVGTAILVMAIPLIDGVFTIGRRILSRQSPFSGDQGHLHHKLLELGWSSAQIALFYWVLCAILGAIALSLTSTGKLFALIIAIVAVLGGLLWLNMTLPLKVRK